MTGSEDAAGQSADIVRGWEAAAEVAGRSVAGVRKLVADGRLAARRDDDGAYLFERSALLAVPRVVRAPEDPSTEEPPTARSDINNDTPPGSTALAPMPKAPVAEALDGVLAAKLFEAFEAGSTVIAVVVTTKVGPGVVEAIYETWKRLKAADATAPVTRLDALEAAVNQLSETVGQIAEVSDGCAGSLTEQSTTLWRLQQALAGIATRVTAVERAWRR